MRPHVHGARQMATGASLAVPAHESARLQDRGDDEVMALEEEVGGVVVGGLHITCEAGLLSGELTSELPGGALALEVALTPGDGLASLRDEVRGSLAPAIHARTKPVEPLAPLLEHRALARQQLAKFA